MAKWMLYHNELGEVAAKKQQEENDIDKDLLSQATSGNVKILASEEKSSNLRSDTQRELSKRLYGRNKRSDTSQDATERRVLDPIREQVLKERDEDLINMFEQRKSQRESL